MLQGESDKQRVAHEAAIQEQLVSTTGRYMAVTAAVNLTQDAVLATLLSSQMLRQKLASAEQSSHDALQHKLKAARHDLTKLANKHKKVCSNGGRCACTRAWLAAHLTDGRGLPFTALPSARTSTSVAC